MEEKSSISSVSLISSIFKYSIATWINFVIYGLSLLISAWFIDPGVYGTVDIFISTSTLFMNIFILGLDQSFIRFFNEPPSPLDKEGLFGACFGLSAFALAAAALISCVFFPQQLLGVFFANPLDNVYLALLFLNAFMSMIGRYINILYRMDGNIKLYTLESVAMQFFSKMFYLGAILVNPTFENLVRWTVVGMAVFAFIFFWPNRYRAATAPKTMFSQANRKLLPYGLALAPTAVMLWLNSLFCKVYIAKTIGDIQAGVFSMVSLLSNVVAIIQAGFATFWSAFIYANYKTEQEKIKAVHDYLTFVILEFFCLIVAFEDLIFLFLGPKYRHGIEVFPIMLLVPVFSIIAETTVYGISIAKKPVYDTIGIGLSVVFNVLFCMILAPSIGLWGVCLALAGANVIMFLFRTVIAQRFYVSIISPRRSCIAIGMIFATAAGGCVFSHNFLAKLGLSFGAMAAYAVLYRHQIKSAVALAKQLICDYKSKQLKQNL